VNQLSPEDVLGRLETEFARRAAPYAHRESALLAVLHAVQEEFGIITPAAEEAVARFLGIGTNRVHEAVSFYSLFHTNPTGKYHLRVCHTLSCELCGSAGLLEAIRRKINIEEGQVTPDGLFSLEAVECLGCCDKAPALQINLGEYIGPLTSGQVNALLEGLIAEEKGIGDA
jgi:NADH-quinone oxidoreductase subunit E